jgi:MATE family multidrug resistance protein
MSSSSTSAAAPARLIFPLSWRGTGGIRELLMVTAPLMLSHAATSLNLFIDRTFLAWYSQEAFAAALQAGVMNWMVYGFFFSMVSYVSTFVAQVTGAGIERQAGPLTWQAVYLAVGSAVVFAGLGWLGWPLFRWIGHEGILPELEATYFEILCWGGVFGLVSAAIYGFFAGRGETGMVLFVTLCVCVLNMCLNALMIFEPLWIFPEGIAGAAWATVIAQALGLVIYIAFIAARRVEYESRFAMLSGWRYSRSMMKRLLQFAFPAGVHHTVEIGGFTVFLQIVGLFGLTAQVATNMAMNINLLLFIPAVGLHIAVSILVGQYCGAKDYESAARVTYHTAAITTIYMVAIILVYAVFPGPLLSLFRGGMPEAQWIPLLELAKVLLLVVAFYSLFDGFFLTYSGALKGAGDTRFVMVMALTVSTLALTIPCIILASMRHMMEPRIGLLVAWGLCANYIVTAALINMWRFRGGRWKAINMVGGSW